MVNHLRQCDLDAKRLVSEAFTNIDAFLKAEQQSRAECIANYDYILSPSVKARLRRAGERIQTGEDPSVASLNAVPVRLVPRDARRKTIGFPLPHATSLPRYDSWIPVQTNFWVGKELHLEPYMPFLGDQDVECEQAYEVFEDMAGDAGKDMDLSDGEVNKDGKLVLPAAESERIKYHTMSAGRWRAASREAILTVTDQFSETDETMWRILAQALGMKDLRRLKAVATKAKERRREITGRLRRRETERQNRMDVENLPDNLVVQTMPANEEWSARLTPLKHFCFICHVFPCLQHTVRVEPVLPIEDLETKKREKLLSEKRAEPCSKECFLRPLRRKSKGNVTEWSAEEILLLREAVPIFGLDPCSLAVVVGTRACFEVSVQLECPIEADIAAYEIEKARKPHRVEQKTKPETQGKKDKSKKSNKTFVDASGEAGYNDQDFVPCNHTGPCTAEVCSCVKMGMYCETTCGCNFGRYGEGGATGGVVWLPPSEDAVTKGEARECLNRHYGCLCESGHCSDTTCPCWDQNRACNPDLCECDCTVLPGHLPPGKRGCRNGPLTFAVHKRTYVGNSEIHGFGLFAGDRFEKGDLVGAYSGQLIDTRLADMIGRIYDATNRTYIFNVTESLVIDGGLLGSKAKFCNHTKPGHDENCASRLVRVRGDAYVALFCKRTVEPGEEFLFDYRFTGEVPAWAREERGKSSKK